MNLLLSIMHITFYLLVHSLVLKVDVERNCENDLQKQRWKSDLVRLQGDLGYPFVQSRK